METQHYKELQDRASECAKLAITAPTAALREQYAELSKVWAGLAAQQVKTGSNGVDLQPSTSVPPDTASPAQ